MKRVLFLFFVFHFFAVKKTIAQENIAPLKTRFIESDKTTFSPKKPRASLPFFDDFSNEGPLPNNALWQENQVFINNTMSNTPITQGIATFDGLNENGRPYKPSNVNAYGFADSLTSTTIDLSGNNPSQNLFLSFYFQAQGNGFAPESQDSLMLFFKDNTNVWQEIWSEKGNVVSAFKQVLISIIDPSFFHSTFQFRFVNKASLNSNDDVWNIDYVKLDINRTINDTIPNDASFYTIPNSILFNYQSMPYRHFKANEIAEKSANQVVYLKNNYLTNNTVSFNQNVKEKISNTNFYTFYTPTINLTSNSTTSQTVNTFPISYTPPTIYSPVTIENKFSISNLNATDKKINDTLTQTILFDNYFAYDDGSAEKAYYLLPAANIPAKTALEFTLNQADSVSGVDVFFAPQVPSAEGKLFSVILYQSLGAIGGNPDVILKQQDFYTVKYTSQKNGFSTYGFDEPIFLPAGKYYIGLMQPTNSGSDTIYYGLDVNNTSNSQKLSFNVIGNWFTSTTVGSIMMRPLVGKRVTTTAVLAIEPQKNNVSIYPNPVLNTIYIYSNEIFENFTLFDINGRKIKEGKIKNATVDVNDIIPGNYILELKNKKSTIKKQLCKQ